MRPPEAVDSTVSRIDTARGEMASWTEAARGQVSDSLGGLTVVGLFKETARRATALELMSRAAAIAFYAFSALVPFLVVVITLTIVLLPTSEGGRQSGGGLADQMHAELDSSMMRFLPRSAVLIVEQQLARIQERPPYGLLSVGLLWSLWMASSVFQEVTAALNRIHGVREERPRWKLHFTAILMTVLEATLLLTALLTIVLWPQIAAYLGLSVIGSMLASVVQWVVTAAAVSLSFALALYLGPSSSPRWKWITPGSVIGTVLFLGMSLLFRVYVQRYGSYGATYGSLGGVVVLLLWLQMSSLVLLLAGQMNQVIRERVSATPVEDGCRPPAELDSLSANDETRKAQDLLINPDTDSQTINGHVTSQETDTMSRVETGQRTDSQEPPVAADVMNDSFRTCGRHSTVMEAILIFKEADCGMVPVVEEGKPVGVITDRDVALGLAADVDLAVKPVTDVMTASPVSVEADAPLSEIVSKFGDEGVRRLLVLDSEGRLVGVISWSDVVRWLPDTVMGRMVSDVVELP